MKDEVEKKDGEGGWCLKRGWVKVSVGLAVVVWIEFLGALYGAYYQGREVGGVLFLAAGWPIFYEGCWGIIYMMAYSSRQGKEFREGFGYMQKFFGKRLWETLLKSQPIIGHGLLIAIPVLVGLMAGAILWAVFSD